MKRSLNLVYSTIVLLSCGLASVFAATPTWTCVTKGEVLWQRTAAFGYLIVCTKSDLSGIDAENGSIIWTNVEFAGVSEDGLTEITGTPYFMAVHKGETAIIDGFSGVRVFSAKAEGFSSIGKRVPMYKCGGLLVTGKKGDANAAVMTNMIDGKKRWELNDIDFIFAAFEIDNSSILLATPFILYKLNSETGKEIWKAPTSGDVASLDNMGALGSLIKKAAKNHAEKKQPINAMELHVKPESDAFYLAVETKVEEQTTLADGKKQTSYTTENSYNGYKLSDGSLLWAKPYSLKGKIAKLVLTNEGIILINAGYPIMPGMSMSSMKTSGPVEYPQITINLLGYKDGKPMWGKNGNGLKLKNPAQKVFKNEKGIICVTDNAVNILDPSTGSLLFKKDVKVFSGIVDARELSCGLLLSSNEECTILDLSTQEPLWEKPVKTAPGLYAVKNDKLYLYSTREKVVYSADLSAKAALNKISKTEIKFEGNEKPKSLEITAGGILISSDQNLELQSIDGNSIYKVYFPAPRDPGIIRALNYATAVRAAYYGARMGMVSIELDDIAQKSDQPLEKAMAGAFGEVYGQAGSAYMNAAGDVFKKASARYKATEQTRDFVFILTKNDKLCALLQVSKTDGKVKETIDLGKDKKPIYSVDDVAGKIYYRSEPNKIVNFTF